MKRETILKITPKWLQKFAIWVYENDMSILVRLGLKKSYKQIKYERMLRINNCEMK